MASCSSPLGFSLLFRTFRTFRYLAYSKNLEGYKESLWIFKKNLLQTTEHLNKIYLIVESR